MGDESLLKHLRAIERLIGAADEVISFSGGPNGCESFIGDTTCLSPNSGKRMDAQYLADRVCDPCRLRAALR